MQTMNEKVDKVRAQELRQLKAEGYEPILKHSRWCLLKRPENRPRKQTLKIWELLKYNLRTMRTYLMMEDFQQFWGYSETGQASSSMRGALARCAAS